MFPEIATKSPIIEMYPGADLIPQLFPPDSQLPVFGGRLSREVGVPSIVLSPNDVFGDREAAQINAKAAGPILKEENEPAAHTPTILIFTVQLLIS